MDIQVCYHQPSFGQERAFHDHWRLPRKVLHLSRGGRFNTILHLLAILSVIVTLSILSVHILVCLYVLIITLTLILLRLFCTMLLLWRIPRASVKNHLRRMGLVYPVLSFPPLPAKNRTLNIFYRTIRCFHKSILYAVFGFWSKRPWRCRYNTVWGFNPPSCLYNYVTLRSQLKVDSVQSASYLKLEQHANDDLELERLEAAVNHHDIQSMYRSLSKLSGKYRSSKVTRVKDDTNTACTSVRDEKSIFRAHFGEQLD